MSFRDQCFAARTYWIEQFLTANDIIERQSAFDRIVRINKRLLRSKLYYG